MARRLGRLRDAARNAAELLRNGRLGAPYHAPFEVVAHDRTHRLRRYRASPDGALAGVADPLLLVPPLMVSSEVYDVSPELSAVAWLAGLGIDVWLVDFGAPEREEGGLARTLEDHVLAVDASVERVRAVAGRPVHLGGYSQGGMFCYQAAAYRQGRDLASLVTFGSPVDVRRMLPVRVADPVVDRVLRWVRAGIDAPLEGLEGLPGTLTSTGFKVFAARKELQQIGTFFRTLHDRDALARREPARRFLGGEGFVAWPGPAFKEFVDELVVRNRLTRGGLVIGGRTVSLADLKLPVLYFVGLRDEMARPASVRALRKAAPEAELYEATVRAGHFGIVVGSKALAETWPTVAEWIAWRAGAGERPAKLAEPRARRRKPKPADSDASGLYELSIHALDGLWHRLGAATTEAAGLLHALRWELPRLSRLESLADGDRVSMGRALAEQAAAIPDETFFLWGGRAFSWGEVHARIDRAVDVLAADGVRAGDSVGLAMGPHPDHLAALVALGRLGAVAVVTPPDGEPPRPRIDAEALFRREAPRAAVPRDERRAVDPAFVLEGIPSATGDGRRERVAVTNRRWATSGLVTAAACQLTPDDALLCALPLHHPLALLVAGGGAVVGGCRLAFAAGADDFWDEARRAGATVAVYDGPLLRAIAALPRRPGEDRHPVRLLVGSGADAPTWEAVRARFGRVRILEFHATAGGAAVLANLDGRKPGAVGRPFPGSAWVDLVRVDEAGEPVRTRAGRAVRAAVDEPGVLVARVEAGRALGADDADAAGMPVAEDLFAPGDRWLVTGDRLLRDADGDWWRASC